MTDILTNDDTIISNQSQHPLTQQLQNSPRHQFTHNPSFQSHEFQFHTAHSPNCQASNDLTYHTHWQQQSSHISHNNQHNQKTLSLDTSHNDTVTPPSTAVHSPLHYRKPLNSPNNTPLAYGHHHHQHPHHPHSSLGNHFLYGASPASLQYQRHLNDLLLQQQHLQQQHQRLLSSCSEPAKQQTATGPTNGEKEADTDADAQAQQDLSEECLKRNVAIVLNNLNRYNSALRSIILNEKVSASYQSSVFLDDFYDSFLLDSAEGCAAGNNNCEQQNQQRGAHFKLNNNNNGRPLGNMAAPATPESDYNSNATTPASRNCNMLPHEAQAHQMVGYNGVMGGGTGGVNAGGGGFCLPGTFNNGACNNLNASVTSSMHDFTHDNSDYQWFLDYGYRDGCAGMQRSVLSSLSASYNGLGDLIYYDDLAKNIDANLAEVDMESFRAEDIHSLLSQLPSYCKGLSGNQHLPHSYVMQQQQHQLGDCNETDAAACGAHISQTSTTSTNELIDNSICKSELLFSPVKESHISVDSLDMDAYPDDGDIILTCKANKDNYTIAFEGSVLYSDDSFYAEPNEQALRQPSNKQNIINLHSNLEDIVKCKTLDVSMSRSDQVPTSQQQIIQKNTSRQLQRYPSGNNNTSDAISQPVHNCASNSSSLHKSSSLPNIQQQTGECAETCTDQLQQLPTQRLQPNQMEEKQLNVSHAAHVMPADKLVNLLPMCQIPITCNSDACHSNSEMRHAHQHQQRHHHKHRCCCSNQIVTTANSHDSNCSHGSSSSSAASSAQQQKQSHLQGSASSGSSNPPAFNLVKMFIKQKSSQSSSEFLEDTAVSTHTCMDVSSGCWPSDVAGSSSSSSLEQRLRKKSMNDSGKGSALSRHDEDEELAHVDDCAFYKKSCNSPAHRRRSMPLRHPQLSNLISTGCGSTVSSECTSSRSNSEQLTQISLGSSAATCRRVAESNVDNAKSGDSNTTTERITRSMQTSCGSGLSTRSSISDRFLRCVPPSFLAKLNDLGEECQAPIYVIYPSYALPDLGFVKTHSTSTDVIFSPFSYKTAMGNSGTSSASLLKKRFSFTEGDDEILKTINYKHVVDWKSLATLLPAEYRRRLKHIPEVQDLDDADLNQRPLFCMTPPVRRGRTHICDCAQYFMQRQDTFIEEEAASSSSGSSQQPSSGYRGSSTLLTDSELGHAENIDPMRQLYVYQYDQQRPNANVEQQQKPQPMPRGILRKSASKSGDRNKRNSMIEDQKQTKLSKLEKRRSLQEPPHNYISGTGYVAKSEEQLPRLVEIPSAAHTELQPRKTRLSRKDLDARARAENFLCSLPRSELKYYAEIAAILESSDDHIQYDAIALKKEVSRVLSQQKKVSFNDDSEENQAAVDGNKAQLGNQLKAQRFTTPPNSPNISMANASNSTAAALAKKSSTAGKTKQLSEKEKQKQESNRFKRLQIQWELISKDSSMLKELVNEQQTKSGGSTPTSANGGGMPKSRIPRPVSYPAGKLTTQDGKSTTLRSPSRIIPPKRYSMTSPTTATNATTAVTGNSVARARTPTSRTSLTAPNTPKRSVPNRTVPKVR